MIGRRGQRGTVIRDGEHSTIDAKCSAVVFDLFGTLVGIASSEDNDATLTDVAATLLMPADRFKEMWDATAGERMVGTFSSYGACITEICHRHGTAVDEDKIQAAAERRLEMTKREMANLQDGALGVLSRLKSQGYRIGLVSNISIEAVQILDSSPLVPLIDSCVLSGIEGIKKPDLRMYRLVCERLGVEPAGCLYVADGMERELEAAASVGMRPVMIRTEAGISYLERDTWNGPAITSLAGVFDFLQEGAG